MLTIRLSRVGKKKQPVYRFVVQERARDPWGKHVEIIGHFNPHTNPSTIVIKEDRAKHWLEQGADPSDTVWNMFIDRGLVKGDKRNKISISKKRKVKMAEKAKKAEEKKAEQTTPIEEPKESGSPVPTQGKDSETSSKTGESKAGEGKKEIPPSNASSKDSAEASKEEKTEVKTEAKPAADNPEGEKK